MIKSFICVLLTSLIVKYRSTSNDIVLPNFVFFITILIYHLIYVINLDEIEWENYGSWFYMYDLWCIIVCFMHWIYIVKMLQKKYFLCLYVCVCDEKKGLMLSSRRIEKFLRYIYTFSSKMDDQIIYKCVCYWWGWLGKLIVRSRSTSNKIFLPYFIPFSSIILSM